MSEASERKAIVMSGTGGVWRVRTADGESLEVPMRGRLKKLDDEALKLTVGDEVILEPGSQPGTWAIGEILPRRSQLARRMPGGGHGERIVAANVDQVIIVFAAAKPEPHVRMLDRFLVIAEGNSLDARIIINKIDLVDETETREKFLNYERAGYPMHFTSVKKQVGLEELHDALAGRTSVLSGPSGVGKSSLLNGMYPGLNLRVGEISESVNKGRHTTVGALLHPLPDAGYVVDTPGLREVGMWGMPSEHLDLCFPEFRPLVDSCRFSDCTHRSEPECGVRAAVESGDVSAERYDSYVKLREELEDTERKWASIKPGSYDKKKRGR
ncbi:MAG TPA: ribosome small subunit-dependent GTPase A [Gemmatimonadaceae bacterium]|nr:ribosome small subunit-dependent GTPase A [Gemmatimonadaceae bacterium]